MTQQSKCPVTQPLNEEELVPPVPSSAFRIIFTATRKPRHELQLQEVRFICGEERDARQVKAAFNPGGRSPEGEGPDKATDGDATGMRSKWLDLNMRPMCNSTLEIRFHAPCVLRKYDFITSRHAHGRDPTAWRLWQYTSRRGCWQLLDMRALESPPIADFSSLGFFNVFRRHSYRSQTTGHGGRTALACVSFDGLLAVEDVVHLSVSVSPNHTTRRDHVGAFRGASHLQASAALPAPPERTPSPGLIVLSTFAWLPGLTWGSTVRLCASEHAGQRAACATPGAVAQRQLELIEVLRRNVLHRAVAELHLFVAEKAPVTWLLLKMRWFQHVGRHKVQLVQLSQRPTFADYMRYLGDRLLGRTVVLVNMDVFIAEGWLGTKSPLLPPNTAFFLSRYHRRVDYGVGESANALRIVLNASARAAPASLGGAMHASIRTDVKTRSCDLRAAAHAAWHRCSCVPENFGAYDAYVLRLERQLTAAELRALEVPQNTWAGENIFLFVLIHALHLRVQNPCLSLATVHLHCALPSKIGEHVIGDRRTRKRQAAAVAANIMQDIRDRFESAQSSFAFVWRTRVPNISRLDDAWETSNSIFWQNLSMMS
mmetsp:Transcript_30230/g.58344  ORF Transcript_30230/g.58344 Transcript_30230/m.58344 type:complete len:599 (+) Transcript_30230:109-1905(+)